MLLTPYDTTCHDTTRQPLHMASITCWQVSSMTAMSLGLRHSLRIVIQTRTSLDTAVTALRPCSVLVKPI